MACECFVLVFENDDAVSLIINMELRNCLLKSGRLTGTINNFNMVWLVLYVYY